MSDPDIDQEDGWAVTTMLRGAWIALAVRAMVELGLADAFEGGPDPKDDVATLAERTGADARSLERLLRVLADCGLVSREPQGRYALTSRGALLRADHPSGTASLAKMQTWGANLLTWERLATAVRTGRGMFGEVNGVPVWEALNREPEQAASFNASMARRGSGQAEAIVAACDLTGIDVVVDVGGGSGALLEALLTREPRLRGVVADRADVVAEADQRMAAAGLTDRCSTATIDFFASVPGDGDAYVLSNILHDWGDDDCVRILRVVRDAMASGARLWIVELVLDPDPPRSEREQVDLHLVDLHMLLLFGARERTSAEYAALLDAAGFAPPVVHVTPARWNVIESTRR